MNDMPVRDVISNGQLNWGICSHLIAHDGSLSDVALPPPERNLEVIRWCILKLKMAIFM